MTHPNNGQGQQTVQPTPDNAGVPLVEGGNPAWNDVLKHIPEDKRQEVVPTLKQWDQKFEEVSKYQDWKDLASKGYSPDDASQALDILDAIDNQPYMVYQTLKNHLGLSDEDTQSVMDNMQQQAQQTAQQATGSSSTSATASPTSNYSDITEHPEFKKLKQQADTLAQIALANKQEQERNTEIKQQEAQLEKEFSELKEKYGEFDENEILMRMSQHNMTAEDAYRDYAEFVSKVRQSRQAPMVLGGGGSIPRTPVDPKTLDEKGTKDLVAQMLEHSQGEAR